MRLLSKLPNLDLYKMKEEEFEYPIPIDAGQGIPLVLAVCSLVLLMTGGLLYSAWISKNTLVQSIVAGLFLYLVIMLIYRSTETKRNVTVPDFKGWDFHHRDVDKVVSDFQEFLKNRLPGEKASINRFKHGAHETNRTTETKYKENSFKINVGSLDQVIAFDKDKLLLHVEPGVPMDELALVAMAHGVIPQIVPEFPGITVGGAIGGLAGESTGHKYGLFHNTIEEMDVITGDGLLHTNVSRTNKSDLFMAVCCSYGTQGVLVRAAVRVIPAPKYVRTEYYKENSIETALTRMETLSKSETKPEFLDAVALTPSSTLVIAGYPAETIPKGGSQFQLRHSRFDPWFFWYLTDLSQKHISSEKAIHTDYIELDDFLFRFDRGSFWAARHGMVFLLGKSLLFDVNPILRAIWSWLGSTRQMYKICHAPGDIQLAESYIIQDIILPTKEATVSLITFNQSENYSIWPLWICPIRKVEANHEKEVGLGLPLEGKVGDLLFNVGLYGPVNGGNAMNPVEKNKNLERKVTELKGKKWLYAQSFYTRDEFWSQLNKEKYDEVRKHYKNDEVFHEITTKVLLSESKQEQICKNCELNILRYFHKLLPYFGQMALELTTPRFIQPFFGIHHTEMKRYVKKRRV
jgi:FAD/FMN-containing dehydrogenase